MVVQKDTNAPVGYVHCQREGCNTLLIYNGSTSGMLRHKCKENRHSTKNEVSKAARTAVRDKCVSMCAMDLRPFNIVSGEGFINLSQELINTGAKYGQISAKDVLPSSRTVSRHIRDLADQVRDEMIPKVKEAINRDQCAMTCDLWTDNYRKIHYLTITSSYIEECEDKWELRNNVLLTTKFPEVTKTGANILTEIYEQMAELDITPTQLQNVTFVTDQGPNIKKALENHKRCPCIMHCINTVLRHTLNEKFLSDEIPDVFHSIQTARKVVGFMKRSGLVTRLEKSLLPDIETRWNSVYMMLDSFHNQRDQIKNILKDVMKEEKMTFYHGEIMENITNFLKIFKEATDDLEGAKEPTLPFVVPWVFKLLDSCEITADDDEIMRKLKKRTETFINVKLLNELHDRHYLATFLHPSFKELLVLSEDKREEIHENVRKILNTVKVVEVNPLPSPSKKFRKWRSATSNHRDELEKYMSMNTTDDDCKNLLSWWKLHAGSFPKLARLGKEVFCIPASSAASERNFSRAGLIVSEKRSSIDPDRVNDILIIHNNKRAN